MFNEDKFFKSDSPLCKVDTFEVFDIKEGTKQIAKDGWVSIDGDDIAINTNLFPDKNETYSFELVGAVSLLNGNNATVVISFDIESGEIKPFGEEEKDKKKDKKPFKPFVPPEVPEVEEEEDPFVFEAPDNIIIKEVTGIQIPKLESVHE